MDGAQLFISLIVSVIGMAYFAYGKKQREPAFLLSGFVMMVFGYFIGSVWLTALIFAVLCAAPFYFRG